MQDTECKGRTVKVGTHIECTMYSKAVSEFSNMHSTTKYISPCFAVLLYLWSGSLTYEIAYYIHLKTIYNHSVNVFWNASRV